MIADRRTKIVGTIGPSTHSKEMLNKIVEAGLNVARLNFNHGTHGDHEEVIKNLRTISKAQSAPVTLLQDLQGPKIRISKVKNGSINLVDGQKIVVTTRKLLGDEKTLSTDFMSLPHDASVGAHILLDDGNLEFVIEKIQGDEVHCQVITGGELKDNKGMNLPGAKLSVEALTEKDKIDLEFGLERSVDYVALSFVRFPQDIRQLREIIEKKSKGTKIIAKIEKREALDNLEEIVSLSDRVMVAQGHSC